MVNFRPTPILRSIISVLIIILAYPVLIPVGMASDEPKTVTVGTWDNPPLVFLDQSGKIDGLFIDILKQIAQENHWKLEFHHGSWSENYDALLQGKIDLLTVIAYSQERATFLDYPSQTLLNNWGVIYQSPNTNITSIQDLQGKRVALVPKVIHSKVFTKLMDQFNFAFKPVPATNFEQVMQLIADGKADAGVINRVISIMKADKFKVKPTSIIFNPVQVRYATLKGKYPELIRAIDNYLAQAKANKDSYYYHAMNKWLKSESDKPDYSWIIPFIAVVSVIFALVVVYIFLVRREVKRRTAELSESDARFRQLADNINAAFWIVSTDWKEMIYVSPGYEKLWGLPTSSLYTKANSWLDAIHPNDREYVRQDIDSRSPPTVDNPVFREYRITRSDGKESWISTRVYPVYNKEGNVYRIAGISEDITNRKKIELDLAYSKAELETILNSISDAVIYADTNRCLVHFNPATASIFGYTREEIFGKNTKIFYANEEDYEQTGMRQFSKTSDIKSASYEMRYQRKDGSTFIGETFGAKLYDNDGQMLGFIAVIRDVTRRKEVEAELLQHQNHLEELVAERTVELSNLNHELEAFSYSVSHDLRAPLRAIHGFSNMLCDDYGTKLDDQAKDYLNRIQQASVKMGHLIDDLINISRVSRVDLNKETINLSAMAVEILNGFQNDEPQRTVTWEVEKGLLTKADRTLMQVLLQNLLSNAWKYTAKTNNAKIRFYRHPCSDGPDAFCVEDNGTGFDMQYKHKIFEPFERLHAKSDFEGTGIGLATVHRVIKRHAGQIWAESTLNNGSKFYFRL